MPPDLRRSVGRLLPPSHLQSHRILFVHKALRHHDPVPQPPNPSHFVPFRPVHTPSNPPLECPQSPSRLRIQIPMPLRILTFRRLLAQTLAGWWEDKAPRFGAALAYYSVLSLAPLLILITPLADWMFGPKLVQ